MRLYLDHNAGAPLRPAVREAMLAWLGPPANPSSAHREGARARRALEEARAEVAGLIGAAPADIVFTSGATEANNLALRGVLAGGAGAGRIVTTAIEHASVRETARALVAAHGGTVVEVGSDGEGWVAAAAALAAAEPGTAIVSVGLANGEIGVVAPVADIASGLRGRGILLHTDAAQACGRLPVDVGALGVDLLSLSSHKLGGPAGAGALWVRPGTILNPAVTGGAQERGRRAGTENVAALVGFGVAARIARQALETEPAREAVLTQRLWDGLRGAIPGLVRNGPAAGPRLPNTLNVTVPGCAGETLLVLLDLEGIAVSLGSACAAGSIEPSHVLLALGRDPEAARAGVRLSLGPSTTEADVARVIAVLPRVVAEVRRRAAA